MLTRLIRSLAIAEADTPPWSLTWALWVVLIAIVAAFAGTLVAYGLTNGSLAAPLLGWTLGGLVTIAFIWRSRRADRESLRLSFKNVRLYIVLLLGVGMAVLVDVIGLGVTQAYLPAPELAGLFGIHVDLIAWLLAALFMLAVQPVAEELVFRAVLFVSLRQTLGGWLGWGLNAVIYALFHLIVYTSTGGDLWMTLIQPLLAGLFIGAVRANTRSSSAAIAAHIGFGLFALLKVLAVPLP